jgi:threonine dehydrogenase-like Zn-dependent dehydrogenase
VVPIPDDLSYERAVLSEPLSCVVAAQRASKVQAGATRRHSGGRPHGSDAP